MNVIYLIADLVLIYLLPISLFSLGWILNKRYIEKFKSLNVTNLKYVRKSKQILSYAQKVIPKIIIKYSVMLGVFITMLLAVSLITPLEYRTVYLVCTDLWMMIFSLIIYILAVEKKIRVKFDAEGRLKY